MALLDWSDAHKTPREPSTRPVSGDGCPPRGRTETGLSPVSVRPLSFAHVGGGIIWQTYPGHLHLTIEQAEAVMAEVREELIRVCMTGGGKTEAVSMLAELLEAINTARRWRKAQGGL